MDLHGPDPLSAVLQSPDAPGGFPESPDAEDDDSADFHSLSRAVKARRSEYTRRKSVRVKVGSWNVAALAGTEDDIGKWFVGSNRANESAAVAGHRGRGQSVSGKENIRSGNGAGAGQSEAGDHGAARNSPPHEDELTPPAGHRDIYVLGLQEIIDISSPSETLRPYVDPGPSNKWKAAVEKVLPEGYQLISSQQLMGLLILVYASNSIESSISSVSSTSVGTGFMGYMGNKGAVATRIVLGGTTSVVFLNCHLAAGAEKGNMDRRNWDAAQIVSRLKFGTMNEEDDIAEDWRGGAFGEEDFAFWFGDLNYRLDDIPGEDVRRLLHLHAGDIYRTPLRAGAGNEQDAVVNGADNRSLDSFPSFESSQDSTLVDKDDNDAELDPRLDPTSLETTLGSLFPHDQLRAQQKQRRSLFEGWREGDISFLPTYKYDVGSFGIFDSSEKQRAPGWCDRILYRTRRDYLEYRRKTKETEDSRKRDEEMKNMGLEQEAENDSVLFDYDPELDGNNRPGSYDEQEDAGEGDALTDYHLGMSSDAAHLIHYTSHQNIVSSDHKPIEADFVLWFDAVVPEMKAKIHQEVVREFDKVENESRPSVTVVVDDNPEVAGHTRPSRGDGTEADFGIVRYDVSVIRHLTLANTGGLHAKFAFQYRPGTDGADPNVSPPWIRIRVDWPPDDEVPEAGSGPTYTMAPGDSVQVQLVLCIFQTDFVRELNLGNARIEDVLVLRVFNGKDHFIPVHGEWLPTCFSFSLEELTHLPEGGIRQVNEEGRRELTWAHHDNQTSRLSAPRELFKLTEAIAELAERCTAEWEMKGKGFEDEDCPWRAACAGWPFSADKWTLKDSRKRLEILAAVREALDTNTSFSSHLPYELSSVFRLEALAETLLSFLKSLRDGIITAELWCTLESQILEREKSGKATPLPAEQAQPFILESLCSSPVHSVSFTFLTFMLNRVANQVAPLPETDSSSTQASLPLRSQASSAAPPPPSDPTTHQASESTESTPVSGLARTPTFPTSFTFRFRPRSRTTSGSADDLPTPNSSAGSEKRCRVNKSFATIFAGVIFSTSVALPERGKERRAFVERQRSILEPFLSVSV